MVDLTDSDEARFAALRDRLEHVDREEHERTYPDAEFGPIDPMLARATDRASGSFDPDEWLAERKYDGTRLVVQHLDGETRCYTRRGAERSAAIPAVVEALDGLADDVVLDGELTFVDEAGHSVFEPIHTDPGRLADRGLEPYLFVFDVLYHAGEWLLDDGLTDRKERLAEVLSPVEGPSPPGPWDDSVPGRDSTARAGGPIVRSPIAAEAFEEFYRALTDHGEEGVVMKRRGSRYHLGTRSAHWRKVKATAERDAIVVGFTEGDGARSDSFGSLVLTDGTAHIGRVGSGFSDAELAALVERLDPVEERSLPASVVGRPYTPVKPFVVRVRYQEVTSSGSLRAPVYVHSRPDVPLEDVQSVEGDR